MLSLGSSVVRILRFMYGRWRINRKSVATWAALRTTISAVFASGKCSRKCTIETNRTRTPSAEAGSFGKPGPVTQHRVQTSEASLGYFCRIIVHPEATPCAESPFAVRDRVTR
jgi:hypothetical protein